MVINIPARRGNMDGIFDSDHAALEMKLRIPSSKAALKRRITHKRARACHDLTCLVKDTTKLEDYVEALDETLGEPGEVDNVDRICDHIVEAVQHVTTIVCPKTRRTPVAKPWEDEKLKELTNRVRKSASDPEERRKLQKELCSKRKTLMNEYFGQKCDEINLLHEDKKVSQEFKAARNMASGMHKQVYVGCSKTALVDHFTEHFQDRGDTPIPNDLAHADELEFVKVGLEAQTDINQEAPQGEEIKETM